MAKKLVSIIVPVYNKEEKLRSCLESLLEQTLSRIEIILIDDGSTDRSGEICDEYEIRDNSIKVIHKRNGGVSSARNYGLNIATGDYIGFVDADDYIEPDMYSKLLDVAQIHFDTIVQCGHYYGQDDSEISDKTEKTELNRTEMLGNLISGKNAQGYLWNKLYPAELVQRIYFDEKIGFGEDLLWNYRVMQNAERLICISDKLYHYEIDAQSICEAYSEKMLQLVDVYDLIVKEQSGQDYYKAVSGRTKACLIILSHMARNKSCSKKQIKEMTNRLWERFERKIIYDGMLTKADRIKLTALKISPSIYKMMIKCVHKK